MTTKEQVLLLSPFEDEILELIEDQVRNDDNSLTQSDLQGSVMVIVMKIYNAGKKDHAKVKKHNNEYCPEYKDKVLPNEKGNCSLCNAELTEEK